MFRGPTSRRNLLFFVIILLISSIFLIKSTSAQGSGWVTLTSGTSKNLNSVYFTDANNGYAVGQSGTIIKTINGTNWTSLTSGTSEELNSVYFIDASTGYVVDWKGGLHKTTDGGNNWTSQAIGTINDYLLSVYFVNPTTGYVVGHYGKIFKTTDSGASWATLTAGGDHYKSIYFTDLNTGYVVAYNGKIYKTTNGGSSWTLQTSGVTSSLNSIYFIDANTGYAVGNGGIIRETTNGGSSWTSQTSGTTQNLYSVNFIDANNGFAVGANGTIVKTTDSGNTWTAQTSGTSSLLKSIVFANTGAGYVVGANGTILKISGQVASGGGTGTIGGGGVSVLPPKESLPISVSSSVLSRNAWYDDGGDSDPITGNFKRVESGTVSQISQIEKKGESLISLQVGDNGNVNTSITWKNPLIVSYSGGTNGTITISDLIIKGIATGGNAFPWKQSGSDVFLTGSESYPSINNAITMQKVGIGMKSPGISLAIGDNDTGLDWVSDGKLNINVDATKTNGTPTMSLISKFPNSGYVGIGTTSPTQALTLGVDKNLLGLGAADSVSKPSKPTHSKSDNVSSGTYPIVTLNIKVSALKYGDESELSLADSCDIGGAYSYLGQDDKLACTFSWSSVSGATGYRVYLFEYYQESVYDSSFGGYINVNHYIYYYYYVSGTSTKIVMQSTTAGDVKFYNSNGTSEIQVMGSYTGQEYNNNVKINENTSFKISANDYSWINNGGLIIRELVTSGSGKYVCANKTTGKLFACKKNNGGYQEFNYTGGNVTFNIPEEDILDSGIPITVKLWGGGGTGGAGHVGSLCGWGGGGGGGGAGGYSETVKTITVSSASVTVFVGSGGYGSTVTFSDGSSVSAGSGNNGSYGNQATVNDFCLGDNGGAGGAGGPGGSGTVGTASGIAGEKGDDNKTGGTSGGDGGAGGVATYGSGGKGGDGRGCFEVGDNGCSLNSGVVGNPGKVIIIW